MKIEQPSYDAKNADDLTKLMLGLVRDVMSGNITDYAKVKAVNGSVDCIHKGNVNHINYLKLTKSGKKISFFED